MKVPKFAARVKTIIWQRETAFLAVAVAVLVVLSFFLSTLPVLSADIERETAQQASSLRQIIKEPLHAPYKLAVFTLTTLSPSIRAVRTISLVYFALTLVAMYYTLRHWHTVHASVITTIVFGCNATVLAIARLGTPLVSLMGWFIITAILLWFSHTRSNKALPMIAFVLVGVSLYLPGALWFYTTFALLFRKKLIILLRHIKKQIIALGILAFLLVATPLIVSFIGDVDQLKAWLLLPEQFALRDIATNVLRLPSAFVYRMPLEPLLTVGRLPIFDLSSGMLFLIGLNAYRQKLKLDRTKTMLSIALTAVIVGIFGQLLAAIVILLPFAFSVIAAGIEYLLDIWYSVFPYNAFARSFAVIIVTLAAFFGVYYQTTRFFVVWTQAPETRAVYTESRLLQ